MQDQVVKDTRLLGCFAPIFYFIWGHVLIVTLKNKEKNISRILLKSFADFQDLKNFYKNKKTFKHKFLRFLSFINLPWGPWAGPIGSAVLTFIGYKQKNKQTDRQAKFIYR